MSLIDVQSSAKAKINANLGIPIVLKKMQKNEEATIVDMLRKTILPMETAGSSLVTTHRVLRGLHEFYSRPGNSYFTCPSPENNIMLGIGISTFAGLPPEEKVGEIRDFVYQSNIDVNDCELFLELALTEAKKMGYEKLYAKPQTDFRLMKPLYRKMKFNAVVDQSPQIRHSVEKDLLFREL